ncbi:MAG: bifunctional alpha,alpha-trehalose-phosphate synthase (UDP-forming)/trehalose-phosphatase [Bacillota bacterium]
MISSGLDLGNKRVLIASNRLPVSVSRKQGQLEITPSVGGLATGLSSFHRSNDGLWVGWPGMNPGNKQKKMELEEILQNEYNCFPVYLSATDLKKYYRGFSNRTLWPLFHYFSTYATFDPTEWAAYKKVNQMFCNRLLEVTRPGDIIWVHDYHLLLLPGLLRKEIPDATIGFFLHIPFPSMEIFRCLPWREEILEGMLGADLVGFHSYDYTRHFLNSALRFLGKEQAYGQLIVGDRTVNVDTFPMGIDTNKFSSTASSPAVVKEKGALGKRLKTKKVILSVDRLDFTKGIPERLKAFELFLDKHPQWHGKITYVMLCVPSRTKVREYQLLKSEIDELVGKINGRFNAPGWLPILYMYRSIPFEKLVSLYSAADLALVTPLRDGMNLVAKEYVASQINNPKGALVLSETTGAAAELGEAITVNPNDINLMADAIAEGLAMSDEDKKVRIESMGVRLKKYDIFKWTEDFLNQLCQTKKRQEHNRQLFMAAEDRAEIQSDYNNAKQRLFLLDYDGTLVSLAGKLELARPYYEIYDLFSLLLKSQKNTVVVTSGRDKDTLSEWFGDSGVGMVAEHGAWIREAGEQEWQLTNKKVTVEWKENIYPILEMFSIRTPGSFIEEKSYTLAWHYRKVESELGNLRSKQLVDSLHEMIAGTDLQVLWESKVVEIKPSSINKSGAVLHWLKHNWDFILAMGDDWTDEDIFSVLPDWAWTFKVGFAPFSRARFLLNSPNKARKLLQRLESS